MTLIFGLPQILVLQVGQEYLTLFFLGGGSASVVADGPLSASVISAATFCSPSILMNGSL